MALYKKYNPVGIDKQIGYLQDHLYSMLSLAGWSNYDCYGRGYINKSARIEGKNTVEIDINSKDYKDLLMDDRRIATSFFVLTKPIEFDELAKASLALIFQINIKKLHPLITNRRTDEEAILDIVESLRKNPPAFNLTEVKRGVDDVYGDLNFNIPDDRDNMSDYLVCRFDLNTSYINAYECDYIPKNVEVSYTLNDTVLHKNRKWISVIYNNFSEPSVNTDWVLLIEASTFDGSKEITNGEYYVDENLNVYKCIKTYTNASITSLYAGITTDFPTLWLEPTYFSELNW